MNEIHKIAIKAIYLGQIDADHANFNHISLDVVLKKSIFVGVE